MYGNVYTNCPHVLMGIIDFLDLLSIRGAWGGVVPRFPSRSLSVDSVQFSFRRPFTHSRSIMVAKWFWLTGSLHFSFEVSAASWGDLSHRIRLQSRLSRAMQKPARLRWLSLKRGLMRPCSGMWTHIFRTFLYFTLSNCSRGLKYVFLLIEETANAIE